MSKSVCVRFQPEGDEKMVNMQITYDRLPTFKELQKITYEKLKAIGELPEYDEEAGHEEYFNNNYAFYATGNIQRATKKIDEGKSYYILKEIDE